MSMFPEAVPIIGQEVSRVPNLVFTNKLAMELRGEVGPAIIKRLRMLSKEAIGIVRINGRIHARLPNSLSKFDKAIVILGPGGVGESWLRYIMSLSNTVIGFTFDSLMRIMNARPHLLNIPNELFIDPVINGETPVLPRAIPKVAIDWLMDYVDSGGDLYVLVRGDSINNIDLIMHSRLLFTYDIKLAELYNSIIKGNLAGNSKVIVNARCDFCGDSPTPICALICSDVDLVREVGGVE